MYEWLEISSWKQRKNGTSKVYQDSKGNVRIDSFIGDVRDSKNHYRVTLKLEMVEIYLDMEYDHEDKFDTATKRKDKLYLYKK